MRWAFPVDGATVGLAGAAQLLRIDRTVQTLRKGRVVKTTHETVYGVTSLCPEETDPDRLLAEGCGCWAIETKQHCRRDHTRREDYCQVRKKHRSTQPPPHVVSASMNRTVSK